MNPEREPTRLPDLSEATAPAGEIGRNLNRGSSALFRLAVDPDGEKQLMQAHRLAGKTTPNDFRAMQDHLNDILEGVRDLSDGNTFFQSFTKKAAKVWNMIKVVEAAVEIIEARGTWPKGDLFLEDIKKDSLPGANIKLAIALTQESQKQCAKRISDTSEFDSFVAEAGEPDSPRQLK